MIEHDRRRIRILPGIGARQLVGRPPLEARAVVLGHADAAGREQYADEPSIHRVAPGEWIATARASAARIRSKNERSAGYWEGAKTCSRSSNVRLMSSASPSWVKVSS